MSTEEKKDKKSPPFVQVRPAQQPEHLVGKSGQSLLGTPGPVRLSSAERPPTMLGGVPQPRPIEEIAPPRQPETIPEPVLERYPEPAPSPPEQPGYPDRPEPMAIRTSPSGSTSWSPTRWKPRIEGSAFVHRLAVVTGNVRIGESVLIASGTVIRGDNEEPIFIGPETNIQENVVLKDLPTVVGGKTITQRVVDVGAVKYSLYIGSRVSVCPQAQLHGPAYIGDEVYVGMQSLVFWSRVEPGVVIEPGCLIMNVTVPSGVFVPAGLKITNQKMVKDLPPLTVKYRFHGIGAETVASNLEMLRTYGS